MTKITLREAQTLIAGLALMTGLCGLAWPADVPAMINTATEAVVAIEFETAAESNEITIGWIVGSDGYILTALAPGETSRSVSKNTFRVSGPTLLDGQQHPGRCVAFDSATGFMLLQVDQELAPFGLAQSDDPVDSTWILRLFPGSMFTIDINSYSEELLNPPASQVSPHEAGHNRNAIVVNREGHFVAFVCDGQTRVLTAAQAVDFLLGKAYEFKIHPKTIDPLTSFVTFEIEPRIPGLGEIQGMIVLKSDIHEQSTAQIPRSTGWVFVPVHIGELNKKSGKPPHLTATVNITNKAGDRRFRRRFRLPVSPQGWGGRVTTSELAQGDSEGKGHIDLGTASTPGTSDAKKHTLTDIAGKVSLNRDENGDVVLDDRWIQDIGKKRLVSARYENLPVGIIRSHASQYDSLEQDFKNVLSEMSNAEMRMFTDPDEDYYSFYEKTSRLYQQCTFIGEQGLEVALKLVKAEACRCSDGTWFLKRNQECQWCGVVNFAVDQDGDSKCGY